MSNAWGDSWGASWGDSWGADAAGVSVSVPCAETNVLAFAPNVSAQDEVVAPIRTWRDRPRPLVIEIPSAKTWCVAFAPTISANDETEQNNMMLLLLAA